MVNRVVFLDYDGVLNDVEYLMGFHESPGKHSATDTLDPRKIALLAQLCRETGAKVVLTSSWRDDLSARTKLKRAGIDIYGVVPHKHDVRGLEISQWLKDKHYTGQWIIIDDESSDLSRSQREHLILTREPGKMYPALGLQPKHLKWALAMFDPACPRYASVDFVAVILSVIENDWLRVMGNIFQADYESQDPFQNTGNVRGYHNDTFEVHAYDWGWDYNSISKPQPVNFRWRDFKVWWYKRLGRGMYTNRKITHDELVVLYEECMDSLAKWERKLDDFYN